MEELDWGLFVIGYLFLAGVGAGAILVSASLTLGAGDFGASRFTIARYGAFIAPLPVIVGTGLLILELGRPFRALNLFKLINLSPMSLGSWFVGVFITVSLLYALTFIPRGAGYGDRLDRVRTGLAWACLPCGFAMAIYTAFLIGAMPARPFWNSPAIVLLFVLSALSGGVASVVLALAVFHRPGGDPVAAKDRDKSAHLLGSADAVLLLGELAIILLFLLFAQLSIGSVKEAASAIHLGGPLGVPFWGLVVMLGILVPAGMELGVIAPKLVRGKLFNTYSAVEILAPVAILIGGFSLRYIVVVAGQITGPIGI
jgi:formate-dependent nitrite reductase membrane component NrfD